MLGLGLSLTKVGFVKNPAKVIMNAYVDRVIAAGGVIQNYDCAYQKLVDLSKL